VVAVIRALAAALLTGGGLVMARVLWGRR